MEIGCTDEQIYEISTRTVHTFHAVRRLHDALPPEMRTVEFISMIAQYSSARAVSLYAIVEILTSSPAKEKFLLEQKSALELDFPIKVTFNPFINVPDNC